MIQKQLTKIEPSDIEELLRVELREDRTTEYKVRLSLDPDSLLKAVSSFANSIGGDLIFGIDAKDGIPTGVPGLDRAAIDKGILRLLDLSRSGLRPSLPLKEFDFKEVAWENGRSVLLLRIPQSWGDRIK